MEDNRVTAAIVTASRSPDNMPVDRYVRVGGVNTRYWCEGEGANTIVIVHGFGVAMEHWRECFMALSQTHRVYALDLVGFGKSDRPDVDYSVGYLADFVRTFLDVQKIESTAFVGHSLGGAVVLQIALSHPGIVSKMVLVATAGLATDVSLSLRLLTLPNVGELCIRPNRILTRLAFRDALYGGKGFPEDLIDAYTAMLALPGACETRLKILRALGNWRGLSEWVDPIRENLHTITMPVLLLWGKQDNVLPVRIAYEAMSALPNAKLHVFDSCGHNPQMEYPLEVRALIAEFV